MDVCKKKRPTPEEFETSGERWVWMSFAPQHRFILTIQVGFHSTSVAVVVIKQSCKLLVESYPLWVSDCWDAYQEALLFLFHVRVTFPSTGKRGRPKLPRIFPVEKLTYAQVVKQREKGRIVSVSQRVVYGDSQNVCPKEISTSLIERENLSLRQENGRLSRKTIAFSKSQDELQKQMDFFKCYHNFVRPHRGLKERVDEVVVGKVKRVWKKRTPAMSIGLTNHIWSLRELMTYKRPINSVISNSLGSCSMRARPNFR